MLTTADAHVYETLLSVDVMHIVFYCIASLVEDERQPNWIMV